MRGQVIDYRCTIEIDGVRIAPGDLVIPRAVEAEAVAKALDKVRTENKVADAIRGGMSACEALATFGVM